MLPVQEEVVPLEMEELMKIPVEEPEIVLENAKRLPEGMLKDDDLSEQLTLIQARVLEKLMGRKALPLIGLEDEIAKVYQVVEQTVVSGEGNSMLVIGARGCGKTTLVEKVISDLSKENKENFHVVRLNGFIHTDDKLALRDIWRQLGKEMEVEEDLVNKTSNYADTLASLLALLSHPDEISAAETGATAKSVVFVIDEFDLFTQHARQTLLYNLFDIAQARKAPIAVLGVTTRIDVVEALEKRVKSRFSHRYVHLPLPKSFTVYKDLQARNEHGHNEVHGRDGRYTKSIRIWRFHALLGSHGRGMIIIYPCVVMVLIIYRKCSTIQASNNTSNASSTVPNPSPPSSPPPSSQSPPSHPQLCHLQPSTSSLPSHSQHQTQNFPSYHHYQHSTWHS